MPRFFFDVHDGLNIVDETGTECADLAAARREAITTAGEMLKDKAADFWTGEPWTMRVRDDKNAIVCELTFTASWPVASADLVGGNTRRASPMVS